MTEQNLNAPAAIPEQPEAKLPLKKGMPVVIALVAILAILGIANVSSLLRGNKKAAPASALQMRRFHRTHSRCRASKRNNSCRRSMTPMKNSGNNS